MDAAEAHRLVTWVNQYDPRVENSPVNFEVWARVLAPFPYEQCKEAALHFFSRSKEKITPYDVKTLIGSLKESALAKKRALEPPVEEIKSPYSLRRRNPGEWDRLYEIGRREGDEMRARNADRLSTT